MFLGFYTNFNTSNYFSTNSFNFLQTETQRRPERKSSMVRKEYLNKSYSRSERRLTDISDSEVQREPDPDYTPRLRRKVITFAHFTFLLYFLLILVLTFCV